MKNQLLILLLLLLVGCKTPAKVVEESQITIRDNSYINIESRHEIQGQNNIGTTTDRKENTITKEEIITTTYDTDKPIDNHTGKPPIQSETTTHKTTFAGMQEKEHIQAISYTAESQELTDQTKKDVLITAKTTIKEKPKTYRIAYIFYIIVIMVIVAAGWYFQRKNKWIKKIFRWF